MQAEDFADGAIDARRDVTVGRPRLLQFRIGDKGEAEDVDDLGGGSDDSSPTRAS